MHKIAIPSFVVDRVMQRRGRLHVFNRIDPVRTAMIVVDLQNGFMAPGQPSEIANAREIVPNVNAIGDALRAAGGQVVYIQNTVTDATRASWGTWFDNFMEPGLRGRMVEAFTRGSFGHAIYPDLTVQPHDWTIEKERFGAFVPGSSALANTSVKWPSSRRSTASTDSAKSPAVGPCLYCQETRCTATSVSVSLANSTPVFSRSSRSAA